MTSAPSDASSAPPSGVADGGALATRDRPRPAVARAAFALAAALVVLHVAIAWRLRPLWVDVGDDATYLLLGRSLRSLAYRSIYLAGAPRHVQYPPGYPALLAAVGALFGERVAVFAAVQSLLSGAALALLFDAVRLRLSLRLALLALAACAVNPLLVASAPSLLSESPFLALCALSLWAAARDDGSPSSRWLVLAGAAAFAAALTRTAGVALVAALLLTWAGQRRWRPALALLAVAAVALGGWFLWTAVAPRDALHYSYASDLARGYGGAPIPSTGASPASTPPAGGVVAAAARGVGARVAKYLTQILPFSLPVPTIEHTRLDNVAWLGVIVAFGGAGAWALWRRWRAAARFLLCYAAVLAAWPWALDRLLIPVLPLVVVAILAGIGVAAARWPGALLERVVPVAFVVALMVTAAGRDEVLLRQRGACLAAAVVAPAGTPACASPKLRSVFDAFDYVRDHTGAGDTVLVFYGPGFYVRAGRVTLPIGVIAADAARSPAADSADTQAAAATPPSADKFVLLTLNSPDEWARAAAMRRLCDRLILVRRFPPAAMVLRTPAGAGPAAIAPDSGRETCAVLDRFLTTPWSPTDVTAR